MRALVASEDQTVAQRVRSVLIEQGAQCAAGHLVAFDSAADRSGLLHPDLVVFVVSSEWKPAWAALRETRSTVPRIRALVVGPAHDPKKILESLKQGADEFLDLEAVQSELCGAMERFRNARHHASSHAQAGRVISFAASCGGCGASMLAASVSTVLAHEHGQCGLVELRAGTADLAAMLDLQPGRSLADLCDHVSRLDQSMFEQFLTSHGSGVQLLASPVTAEDLHRVTVKGVRRALALARLRFPTVVIDLGSVVGDEQLEALWQTDVLLLVVRPDYTAVRNARRMIDGLIDLGIGRDRMRPVVNGGGQRHELSIQQIEAALGAKVVHRIPYDAASLNLAVNSGVPVVLKSRFSRIAKRIRTLAHSVNGVEK